MQIGWFFFMFAAVLFTKHPQMFTPLLIIGLSLCLVAAFFSIFLLSNDLFKSIDELYEEKQRYYEACRKYQEASKKLESKLLNDL
jgi:hypothetical protein